MTESREKRVRLGIPVGFSLLSLVLWVLADADGSVLLAFLSIFVGGIAATRLWDHLKLRVLNRQSLPSNELLDLRTRLEEAQVEISKLQAAAEVDEGLRLGDGQGAAIIERALLKEEEYEPDLKELNQSPEGRETGAL